MGSKSESMNFIDMMERYSQEASVQYWAFENGTLQFVCVGERAESEHEFLGCRRRRDTSVNSRALSRQTDLLLFIVGAEKERARE